MQLEPYIFCYGRCEEALEFYKSVLGGSFELNRNTDGPMAEKVPEHFRGKVMHASFKADGVTFMASDGWEARAIDSEASNISLAISCDDRAAGERIFNALSAGGKIKQPLADAFWGGKFGMFDDRFGIEWMVTSP